MINIVIQNKTSEDVISCFSVLEGLGYYFRVIDGTPKITLQFYKDHYLQYNVFYFTLNQASSLCATNDINLIPHALMTHFRSLDDFLGSNYNRRIK